MRSVDEWVAKSDDEQVPPRVRLRVLERYNRTCYLSGVPIRDGDKWELEHIQALILGGQHRENNLAPALVEPHKRKTAIEMKIKSKIARVAKKAAGIKKTSRFPKRPSGVKFNWAKRRYEREQIVIDEEAVTHDHP